MILAPKHQDSVTRSHNPKLVAFLFSLLKVADRNCYCVNTWLPSSGFFFEDWVLVSRVQCRWAIASVAEVQIELMNVISKGAHKNYSWRTKSRESQGNIPMCMYSMWNNGLLHKATSLLHLNEKCEEILKVTEVENRPKNLILQTLRAKRATFIFWKIFEFSRQKSDLSKNPANWRDICTLWLKCKQTFTIFFNFCDI